MHIRDFKKRLKEFSGRYKIPIGVWEKNGGYYIYKKGGGGPNVLAFISDLYAYSMDTNYHAFSTLDRDAQTDLFGLISLLAETDHKDRGRIDLKKYYVRKIKAVYEEDDEDKYLLYDRDKEKLKLVDYKLLYSGDTLEEIKEKFGLDLKEFEIILDTGE